MGKDNLKTKCKGCGKGIYVETSLQDDWDGVLHCNKCGTSIARYDEPPKFAKKFDAEFIPISCRGEKCSMCGEQAHHKVAEVLFEDDPTAWDGTWACRHESTAYVCSKCFSKIMGRTTIPGFKE